MKGYYTKKYMNDWFRDELITYATVALFIVGLIIVTI